MGSSHPQNYQPPPSLPAANSHSAAMFGQFAQPQLPSLAYDSPAVKVFSVTAAHKTAFGEPEAMTESIRPFQSHHYYPVCHC